MFIPLQSVVWKMCILTLAYLILITKLKLVFYFSQTFDTLYSPSYGKCYMFNYGGVQDAEGKVQIVKHPGKSHGKEYVSCYYSFSIESI